jgi:nucleotide-binding universal stress UspA family protein
MGIHALDLAPVSDGPYGEKPRLTPLVVGFDGSPASKTAFEYACKRSGTRGRVIAVYVDGAGPSWFGAPSYQHEDANRPFGESLLAELAANAPHGVHVERSVMEGPPPSALLQVAREYGAVEIVVGMHGSDPSKAGLGHVPKALIETSDRPVVVVPPAEPRR